jgi:beta-glucanase (GH16 family)
MKLLKHFDFTNDVELDLNYWNVRVGDKWANNELQHYVDKSNNLYFDDGLVIQGTLKNGVYESSRIDTKGKLFFKYGRIVVKVKLPKGIGTWPAVWLMSEESKYGRWPRSGEIDLVEHVGRKHDNVFFCLHTEAHNHRSGDYYYKDYQEVGLSDNINTFSLLWEENTITYYVNDKEIVQY